MRGHTNFSEVDLLSIPHTVVWYHISLMVVRKLKCDNIIGRGGEGINSGNNGEEENKSASQGNEV